MKKSNKILLISGVIVICLGLVTFITISKDNQSIGTFGDVILNEKYKNVKFSSVEIKGVTKATAHSGIATSIREDTINEVIDTLKGIKLKEFTGIEYDVDNFMNVTFTVSNGGHLEVVVIDNKVLLIKTNASSDEGVSEGFQIVNYKVDVMKKLEDIYDKTIRK